MRIPRSLLVLFALCSPVHADDDEEQLRPPTAFNALSFRFGDRDIVGVETSFDGAALALGRRFGATTLYGEGEVGYQRRDDLDGLAAALAVHARRTVCPFVMGDSREEMRIPCFVDIGAGWRSLWTGDESLSRPFVSLGVGGGVEAASRRYRGGMLLGIAVELSPVTGGARRLARSIENEVERSVVPAEDHRVDVAVSFSATFLFGR